MAKQMKKGKNLIVSSFLVMAFLGLALILIAYPPARAVCNAVNDRLAITSPSYPGFGINLPEDYEVHGIDVSRHQRDIDWEAVSNMFDEQIGISFAFIKATEGRTVSDDYFEYNWKQSKKNNMLRGAYHFFRPHLTAEEQASFFFSKVKLDQEDLPPVLDIEIKGSASPSTLKTKVKRWLVLTERHYGVTPIIYTNYSFYKNYFSGKEFEKYPFWIAHYATADLNAKTTEWHFWQHHDRGHVNGIRGGVDFNVFKGSYDDLLKLCKK
jgi:lysozyme